VKKGQRVTATGRLELRIPTTLKKAAEQAATDRGIKLAALLKELLTKYLQRTGYLSRE
jgi:hypothetical protein